MHAPELLHLVAQQGESLYGETEDQDLDFCFISCLHRHPVAFYLQRHVGTAEQLLGQLEGLVVLQQHLRKTREGQGLSALLQPAHLVRDRYMYGDREIDSAKNSTPV